MRTILMTAILAAALISSVPAFAEDAAQGSIGVVNTNKIMHESEAAKSISAALDAKRKEFAAQISKEQESLRTAGQKFEKKKATVSKEEGEATRKDLNEKLYSLQKMIQGRESILEKSVSAATAKLRMETKAVTAEVAKEKNISVVLTQDAVLLALPQMDITDEVIKRLDGKVKKIPVEWAEPAKDKKAKD